MAAIMVILFHLQHLKLLAGSAFVTKSDIFVDFFFVLSGFVITHSNYAKITDSASIGSFVTRRFRRLYPLHLFTLLLVLLFELFRYGVDRYVFRLTNAIFGVTKSFSAFMANLTLTQSLGLFDRVTWNEPSWSISAEFYTYIVWACSLVLFRKNVWVLCSISFSLLAWFIIRHNGNIIYNYDYGFVRCLYSFLIGMVAYRLARRLPAGGNYALSSLLEISLLGFTIGAVSSFTHGQSWSMPLLFAVVIVAFSRESGFVARLLAGERFAFLGQLSYSYYLNHLVVLAALDLLLFKALKLPHTELGELAFVLICLACIHLMSVFTYRYVELIGQPASLNRTVPAVVEPAFIQTPP